MNHGQRPQDEYPDRSQQSPRRIEVNPAAGHGPEPGDMRPGARRMSYQAAHLTAQPTQPGEIRQPTPGWDLGQPKPHADASKGLASKGSMRTILIAGGGIVVIMLALSILLASSGDRGVMLTKADQQVLSDYRKYLSKANPPPADADSKVGQVEQRLKAFRWAASLGDKHRAEQEYERLLLMDSDRSSPLYRYCVANLRGN
jgi:hypothetical protein